MNTVTTATYWERGRRIVLEEQHGKQRAGYGETLLQSVSAGLTARFGRRVFCHKSGSNAAFLFNLSTD